MPITEEQLRAMDAELDAQFLEEKSGTETPQETAPAPEQNSVTTPAPEPQKPIVDEKPTPDNPPAQPKADDKAAHAFEQMRKKNKELEEKANAERERVAKLEALAKKSGFASIEEFEAALEAQVVAAEAKKRNSDPATIKELQDTKARLDAIERERAKQVQQQRLFEVSTEIERLRTERGLSADEMTSILTEMETEGYTVEKLLSNPTKTIIKMVEAYAAPLLVERQVQTRLSKLSKEPKVPTEKPATSTTPPDDNDWRKQLEEEMKEYARVNYPYRK